MRQLTCLILSYRELDRLVNHTWHNWNDRFSCVAEFGWSNESDHMVLDVQDHLTQEHTSDQYTYQKAMSMVHWSAGRHPHAEGIASLLDTLCYEGTIQPGHYIIRASW